MEGGDRAQIRSFAEAVSALAVEASLLAHERGRGTREAAVARKAAEQAGEAAATLDRLAEEGHALHQVMTVAAWALSAAAVAVTQARAALVAPPQ